MSDNQKASEITAEDIFAITKRATDLKKSISKKSSDISILAKEKGEEGVDKDKLSVIEKNLKQARKQLNETNLSLALISDKELTLNEQHQELVKLLEQFSTIEKMFLTQEDSLNKLKPKASQPKQTAKQPTNQKAKPMNEKELTNRINQLSNKIDSLEKQHKVDINDTKDELYNTKERLNSLHSDVNDLIENDPQYNKKFPVLKTVTALILAGLITCTWSTFNTAKDTQASLEKLQTELSTLKTETNQKFDLLKTVETTKGEKINLASIPTDEIDNMLMASFERIHAKRLAEQQKQIKADFKNADHKVTGEHPVYGNPNARFTIYEISDLDCPFCKRYHPVVKSVVDGSNGNINQVWIHFPIDQLHPNSPMVSLIAQCVNDIGSNTMFWAFVDGYFKHQGDLNWVQTALHSTFGIDQDQLKKCMTTTAGDSAARRIAKDNQFASKYGVNGTPTSVIKDNKTGREQVINGAYGKSDLEIVMNAFIKQSEMLDQDPKVEEKAKEFMDKYPEKAEEMKAKAQAEIDNKAQETEQTEVQPTK